MKCEIRCRSKKKKDIHHDCHWLFNLSSVTIMSNPYYGGFTHLCLDPRLLHCYKTTISLHFPEKFKSLLTEQDHGFVIRLGFCGRSTRAAGHPNGI